MFSKTLRAQSMLKDKQVHYYESRRKLFELLNLIGYLLNRYKVIASAITHEPNTNAIEITNLCSVPSTNTDVV